MTRYEHKEFWITFLSIVVTMALFVLGVWVAVR